MMARIHMLGIEDGLASVLVAVLSAAGGGTSTLASPARGPRGDEAGPLGPIDIRKLYRGFSSTTGMAQWPMTGNADTQTNPSAKKASKAQMADQATVENVSNLEDILQVRLDKLIDTALDEIVSDARRRGDTRASRSFLARWAVEAYVGGLASIIDDGGDFDVDLLRELEGVKTNAGYDGMIRVRLARDTIKMLDTVEAYAGGLGFRKVTRSSMIRAAITAFVVGFALEVAGCEASGADLSPRRSGTSRN